MFQFFSQNLIVKQNSPVFLYLCASLLFLSMGQAQATLLTPPVYEGTASFNTMSHGGGYSSAHNEYWYPQWSGTLITRYDSNYNPIGTFNSPVEQIMQLWGEQDGSYYTANWSFENINHIAGMNDNTINWTYDLGNTASGVTADDNFVYAMDNSHNKVHKLDKNTGTLIEMFLIDTPEVLTLTYGGLFVVDDFLFRVDQNANVIQHSLIDHSVTHFNFNDIAGSSTSSVYNLSFNGTQVLYSDNSNTTSHVFTMSTASDIPEPSVIVLMGLGLLGFSVTRYKPKKH